MNGRGKRASNDNSTKIGRPTKYQPGFVERVLGLDPPATNTSIAAALGVHVDTVIEWRKIYPAFSDAVKTAKERADDQVESALYHNANVKHNVAAQIFWLKNRRPDKWRDKIEHEVRQQIVRIQVNIGGKVERQTIPVDIQGQAHPVRELLPLEQGPEDAGD